MEENKSIGEIYAVFGLVFAIISLFLTGTFVFSILGLVFSSIARKKDEGNGKAQAGFVISIISLILSFLLVIVTILIVIGSFLMTNN